MANLKPKDVTNAITQLNSKLYSYKYIINSLDDKKISDIVNGDVTSIELMTRLIPKLTSMIDSGIQRTTEQLASLGKNNSIENFIKQLEEARQVFSTLENIKILDNFKPVVDTESILAEFKKLESLVKLANKTGVGDASYLRNRYRELNGIAHEIGAFKNTDENSTYNSMANARLAQHINDYYKKIEEQATRAGQSVQTYTEELLKSNGIERQVGESDVDYNKRVIESINEKARKLEEYERKLKEVQQYVHRQEVLTGKVFEFNGRTGASAEVDYYNSQLSAFDQNTDEYFRVLELKRDAERRVAREAEQLARQQEQALREIDQAQQARDRERQAQRRQQTQEQERSIQNIKNRITSITSTVASVGKAINNAINSVIGAIRRVLSVVRTVFNGAINIVRGFKNTVTKLITLFGNLGNRVRSAFNTAFNNELIKKAETLYQSIYSLKNIVGYELTQQTIDWANSMERAFGISARGLISDLNELSGVLYGLGMSAEHVATGSQNILMMSRYLAFMGAAGGDVAQVTSKLNSGLKGMTQAIDDLGLSVRESQMDSYLKSLKALGGEYANIGVSFANLNEEQRIYVRYSSLIQQFKDNYDMSTFAEALTTTTGKISILKESINSLKTTLGQVFIELFGRVAGYITYIVRVVEQKIINLTKLWTGIDLTMSADTNAPEKLADNLGNVADGMDDVAEASKRASSEILGFDNVTKIGNNSGKDDFDYSSLFNTALEGLDEYAKQAENYMLGLENKFKQIFSENIIRQLGELRSAITGEGWGDTVMANDNSTWLNILGIVHSISNALKTIWNDIVKPLLDVLGNWGKNDLLPWLNTELRQLGTWISDHSTDLVKILKDIGNFAWDGFKKFVDIVGKLVDYAVENPDAIVNMFKGLVGLKIGSWAMSQAQVLNPLLTYFGTKSAIGALGAGGASAGAGAAGLLGGISVGSIAAVASAIIALIAVITNLNSISESFHNTLKTVGESISLAFGRFADIFKVSSDGTGVLSELKSAFDEVCLALEPVIRILVALSGGVLTGIIENLAVLVQFIVNGVAGALNLISGIVNILIGIVTGDGEKIKEGLSQIGESILDFVFDTIKAVIGLGESLISAISTAFYAIGTGLIDGFEGGINKAWHGFMERLDAKWESLVTRVKNFLGIHSPSTVFADIGFNMVQGLINGISNAWGSLKTLVENKWNELISIPGNLQNMFISGSQKLGLNIQSNITSTKANTSGSKLLSFAGFRANSGSIPAGSAVIGNEGGRLEMYGKLSGGMSIAANNQLITDALYKAMLRGITDGLATSGRYGDVTVNINNDGLAMYDESSIRRIVHENIKPILQE